MVDIQLINSVVLVERRNQSGLLSGLLNPVFFMRRSATGCNCKDQAPDRFTPVFQCGIGSISTTAR